MTVTKIVSGGQTGVDRAALDVAIELGLDHGGWCPRGRRAEDGRIPAEYQLSETASAEYVPRTRLNVRMAGGTLIIARAPPFSPGTHFTVEAAKASGRPWKLVALDLGGKEHSVEAVRHWLRSTGIYTLNVAGPRESKSPGIGVEAMAFLREVLR